MGGNVNLYVILRFRSLDVPLVTLIRRQMKLFKQSDMWSYDVDDAEILYMAAVRRSFVPNWKVRAVM